MSATEFSARHRVAGITARKARRIADLIRGRSVNEALELLQFALIDEEAWRYVSARTSARYLPIDRRHVFAGFKRLAGGTRPDHVGVSAYDGMQLIYLALAKTGGKTDGDALIAAMKGLSWESPREIGRASCRERV